MNLRLSMAAFAAVLALTTWSGCRKAGCLGGEADCHVPSPCQKLEYACTPLAPLDVHVVAAGEKVPGGVDSLGAEGDILLASDTVVAVVAGIGNQNHLDPNGG